MKTRREWISILKPLTITRQCELAGTNRSTVYALQSAALPDGEEQQLLDAIDAEYTRHPFYGSRKIVHYLRGLELIRK